jgi:hypothetical protein
MLLAVLVFFASMTLFSFGGSVPESGMGEAQKAPAFQKAPAAHSTARLMIKRVMPRAVVVGTGFRSSELVRLTGVPVKRVRASAKGTFTIRFGIDPCRSLTITATGSKGSRAAVNYSQFSCPAP